MSYRNMASPASRSARTFPEAASQAILRALPAHVALLDAAGVVVDVNEAWLRFAAENGWEDPQAGIGMSYLAACDGAAGATEADGHAVGAGLRAVLERREPRFEYEYACPSPNAGRWFRLVATPTGGGWDGAVVMHVDITERRLFEDALRESAGQLRNAQRLAGLGYFHMDLPGGRMTIAPETSEMLGCDASELPDWACFIARVHRSEQLPLAAEMEMLLESRGTLDTQVRFFRPDGAMRWLRIRAEAMRPASTRGRIAGTILDITERRAAGEAIRASEERLRRLSDQLNDVLENMPDGFFTLDREWRVTYLNRTSERLVDGPRAAFIGKVLWELFPEEEKVFRPQYELALAEERAVEFEAWSPRLGIWAELRAYPTRGGLGVYFRDVTERRRIQDQLRASEQRLARVAQVAVDAIWDWDLGSGSVWRSKGLERIFGAEKDAYGESEWVERLHPEERRAVVGDIKRTLESAATEWSADYRFRRTDGSYAWVHDRAFIIRDESGKATRVVGGRSDVTEQVRARELLEEQARLLDNARDAIHVRDIEHRVQYLNRSAEELYGWNAQDAAGRPFQTLLQIDPVAFRRAFDHLLGHGEWSGELQLVTRDARRLTIEARWTLLRDPLGVPRRILAIDTDVTERRYLEQQLIRSQRLDSIGTLAGGIAHDLNNVFTPILMAVDLLQAAGRATEDAELLETIGTSAQRGVDMIGQLMSFARGADGARAPLRPEDIVAGVLRIAAETFPKDIVLDVDVQPGLPQVLGDATQLNQVLLNLCVNARDAMPGGGRLRITARLAPEPNHLGDSPCIAFDVEDTGTGIAPAHMEKLWDPFFTTKPPGSGTGLGLPTSLAIVKGHGGQIHVTSTPGEGSRFSVLLPAVDAPLEKAAPAPAPPREAPVAQAPRGEGRHVLVVDDETPIREVARRALEAHGYEVSEAADGRAAVDAFRHTKGGIDLVLLDMMMPVMDGAEAIGALRSVDPGVRILVTTGYATPERMAKVDAAGIPYLLKPYAPEALLRAVADGLGRSS